MSVHPKDSLYVFLLATLQQEQDYTPGRRDPRAPARPQPEQPDYWQDLNMFYMALAQ